MHKHTYTHTHSCWKSQSHRKAALFLLLNEKPIVQSVCPCCHSRPSMKHPSVSIGYLLHKIHTTASAVFIKKKKKNHASKPEIWSCALAGVIQSIDCGTDQYTVLKASNVISLQDLRSLPCLAPPGCHRGLWIARSEPSPRCPILLVQQFTEPPTRRGCQTSDQNMAPMTRTEEEGWPTGTWLQDPQVRKLDSVMIVVENKKTLHNTSSEVCSSYSVPVKEVQSHLRNMGLMCSFTQRWTSSSFV